MWLCTIPCPTHCDTDTPRLHRSPKLMGSTRRPEKGRRERGAARKLRTSMGHAKAQTDWHCPYCFQWFSQRRNGPGNHLRFCTGYRLHQKPSRSHRQNGMIPLVQGPAITPMSTDLSDDSYSSSEEYSQSDSGSESDRPVAHRRRAQKARSPTTDGSHESSRLYDTIISAHT